jgi:tRNA (cmo5U34)-methyltransferase|tara:strand:- start:53 stop:802 length:750 start_codon:yes stop_codon:yes gene_type:complete
MTDDNNQQIDLKPATRDEVFSKPLSAIKAFEFDENVTHVFRDMISRSVPGYELLLRLIGLYTSVFVTDNSTVYDLGCSLGEASLIVENQTNEIDCAIIAIDSSESMIKQCLDHSSQKIDWICADIQQVDIKNASMVILNLTLQFIEPSERDALILKIYEGLLPGGILVLSEKILLNDAAENTCMVELYQAFKKTQGYSDLEISQKRTALENVLIPDHQSTLQQRLSQTGFGQIYQCFRCFNFVSYLAIK